MCEDYRRLLDAYQAATSEHTEAVRELSRITRTGDRAAFRLCWERCEVARKASEKARRELDAHSTEHGCMQRGVDSSKVSGAKN